VDYRRHFVRANAFVLFDEAQSLISFRVGKSMENRQFIVQYLQNRYSTAFQPILLLT
jgi:hypothetical protein